MFPSGSKSDLSKSKHTEITASMKECIAKATEPKEKPIKPKYIQKVVLLASKENGIKEFWAAYTGKGSVLMFWKYFQLFHTIVKENHPTVLRDSHQFKGFIQQQGIYWGSTDPTNKYGLLLKSYCQVILVKQEFHYTNPNIPGSLEMDDATLTLLIENSEKEYLVEMLREILKYWSVIPNFLNELLSELPTKSRPWSNEFHCKFQPFILCIEEVRYLYRYSRTILYKLHTAHPSLNVNSADAMFMNLYEVQSKICTKAFDIEWIVANTDLTFISNQSIPEAIQQSSSRNDERSSTQTNVQRSRSDVSHLSSSRATQQPLELQLTILNRLLPPLPDLPHPSAPPPSDYHNITIQKSNLPSHLPLPPRTLSVHNNETTNGHTIVMLQTRVQELESELSSKSRVIENLLKTNNQLHQENERFSHEAEQAMAELKQLKINSAQQFCQLYATIRERDERINKLESQT